MNPLLAALVAHHIDDLRRLGRPGGRAQRAVAGGRLASDPDAGSPAERRHAELWCLPAAGRPL